MPNATPSAGDIRLDRPARDGESASVMRRSAAVRIRRAKPDHAGNAAHGLRLRLVTVDPQAPAEPARPRLLGPSRQEHAQSRHHEREHAVEIGAENIDPEIACVASEQITGFGFGDRPRVRIALLARAVAIAARERKRLEETAFVVQEPFEETHHVPVEERVAIIEHRRRTRRPA